MDEATNTLQAALFTGLAPVIGMVSDVLSDMADGAGEVARVLQENEGVVKAVALVVGGLALVVSAYSAGISIAAGITKGLTIATEALSTVTAILNGTMALNPFGLVAIAVVAVGVAIYALWKNFKWFREGVMGVWEVVKTVFSNIWNAVKGFVNGITSVLSGLWKIMKNPLNFEEGAEQIGNGIKKAASSFVEGNPVIALGMSIKDGAYQKGANKRAAYEQVQEDKKKSEEEGKVNTSPDLGNFSGGNTGMPSMSSANAVQAPSKSITITINKLVERMEIHSTTIKEGAGQIEDMITQALIKSVNDFQKTAGV